MQIQTTATLASLLTSQPKTSKQINKTTNKQIATQTTNRPNAVKAGTMRLTSFQNFSFNPKESADRKYINMVQETTC